MAKILKEFNGHQVIGVSSSKEVKDISHIDSRLLHNLDYKSTTKSLGLLNLFENARIVKVPFLKNILENNDKLYTNGRSGSITWEVPLDMDYPIIVENVEDTSNEFLGIDGLPFKLKTSHPFKPGDVLTYDYYDGVQVTVIEDSEVKDESNGYVHQVTVVSKDREAYFPASKIVAGTQIFKIGSSLGEYSTSAWSGLVGGGTPKKVTLEHRIGSPQGVEVSYTDFANSITLNGQENSYMTESILNRAQALGELVNDPQGAYLYVGQKTASGKTKVSKVEKLVNVLAMAELVKMTATRLMFSHGATITGINGSKRLSEGIYPQLRRGNRFTYRNEVELEAMIRQASDVIFSNIPIPIEQRQIKFKAGQRVYELVRQIFKEAFVNTFPAFIDQSAIPVPLLTGKDRFNLTYESFAIGKAFVNGIGYVEIEHDPSLDYDFGDVVIRGYSGGLSKRSYSMVIWDVTDPTYTNVYNKSILPKGVEVDQRASGKNLYLVKPANVPDFGFGYQKGRMISETNVMSSMQHMGETFWCASQLDALIPDLSRVVLIEKEDAWTEDSVKYFSN